jgi:hypothetical protein
VLTPTCSVPIIIKYENYANQGKESQTLHDIQSSTCIRNHEVTIWMSSRKWKLCDEHHLLNSSSSILGFRFFHVLDPPYAHVLRTICEILTHWNQKSLNMTFLQSICYNATSHVATTQAHMQQIWRGIQPHPSIVSKASWSC